MDKQKRKKERRKRKREWGRKRRATKFSTIEEICVSFLGCILPNIICVYEDVRIWVHKSVFSVLVRHSSERACGLLCCREYVRALSDPPVNIAFPSSLRFFGESPSSSNWEHHPRQRWRSANSHWLFLTKVLGPQLITPRKFWVRSAKANLDNRAFLWDARRVKWWQLSRGGAFRGSKPILPLLGR